MGLWMFLCDVGNLYIYDCMCIMYIVLVILIKILGNRIL